MDGKSLKIPTVGAEILYKDGTGTHTFETNDSLLNDFQKSIRLNVYYRSSLKILHEHNYKIANDGNFYINDINNRRTLLDINHVCSVLSNELSAPPSRSGATKAHHIETLIYFFQRLYSRVNHLRWLNNFKEPLTAAERKERHRLFRKLLMYHHLQIQDAWIIEAYYYGIIYCLFHNHRHTARIPFVLVSSPKKGFQKSTMVRMLNTPFEILCGQSTWTPAQIQSHFMANALYRSPITFIEDVDKIQNRKGLMENVDNFIHNSVTLMRSKTELKNVKFPVPVANFTHGIATSNTNRSALKFPTAQDDTRMFEISIITRCKELMTEMEWSLDNQTDFMQNPVKIPTFPALMVRYILP